MKSAFDTQEIIETLVQATYGDMVSVRQQHVFREALQALVRLAKAEQMLEMRRDVNKSLAQGMAGKSREYWKVQ